MDEVVAPRDWAYFAVLEHGLVRLRAFAWAGRADLCAVEADHLHNIPSLIGEANENRHLYYLDAERGSYLRQLRQARDADALAGAGWYAEAWAVLAAAAGVGLTDDGIEGGRWH